MFRRSEPAEPWAPVSADQLVILATGEVDLATAPMLQAALLEAVDEHPRVCCDLHRVTFFSAAGVTALLTAHNSAARSGSRLSLRGAHGITRRVLHLAEVDRILGASA